MKYFSYIIIAIVAVAVVAGFFVIGSPANERLKKADDQRVADLQNIQWQIINYWQSKEKMPVTLDDLTDNISGWHAPRDPETGVTYNYGVTGNLSFELCATFNLALDGGAQQPAMPKSVARPIAPEAENWQHPAGNYCFARTIDPDLYPPLKD